MCALETLPELREIVGAMLFVARTPITIADMRRVLARVAEAEGGALRAYAEASEADLAAVVEQLKVDLIQARMGVEIKEVAHGYRLENVPSCGPWLRCLLERSKPSRLSRPALETLAIIAYRQPCTRSEIEKVRGVSVDQLLRNLLEMQLIRIVGRSDLPGRPWLFGTTQKFLEHFGLRSLEDLPSVDELRRMEAEQKRRAAERAASEAAASPVEQGAGHDERGARESGGAGCPDRSAVERAGAPSADDRGSGDPVQGDRGE